MYWYGMVRYGNPALWNIPVTSQWANHSYGCKVTIIRLIYMQKHIKCTNVENIIYKLKFGDKFCYVLNMYIVFVTHLLVIINPIYSQYLVTHL